MKKFYTIILLVVSLSAFSQEKIILRNEGNWQSDNGRLTYFEDGKIISNKWFRDINGDKLGDTPNDIIQINDNLIAIAINWSNIIQFITPEGKAVAATEDVPNNRQLATDGKYVYVSSYGHECGINGSYKEFEKGFVAKIDVTTFKVVEAIEVGYEPEGIAYYNGYLFVANSGGYAFQEDHEYERTVNVINAETMEIVRTIDTGCVNLYGKMSQAGQYLCINTPGDYYETLPATIIFDCEKAINGNSDEECFVVLPYAATYSATTRDNKFITVGSAYSYLTGGYDFNYATLDPALIMESEGSEGADESLPGSLLDDIQAMGQPYGLYINPYTGYYYATDALSYVEGGLMYQWDPDGNFVGKYQVYINPGHFLALPPDGHFTGIRDLSPAHTTANDVFFNILGQRVSKNAKGLLINGNKKIIIK